MQQSIGISCRHTDERREAQDFSADGMGFLCESAFESMGAEILTFSMSFANRQTARFLLPPTNQQKCIINQTRTQCRSPGKELSSLPGLRHTKEQGLDLGKEPG